MMRTFVLVFAWLIILFGNPLYAASHAELSNELSESTVSIQDSPIPTQKRSKDQARLTPDAPLSDQAPLSALTTGQPDQTVSESIEEAPLNSNIVKKRELNAGVSPARWGIVLITLVGMVLFIVLVAWIIKRFGGLRVAGMRDMKVLSAMPVGNREKVALVEVRGQEFLLGVTTHTITHLHTFGGTDSVELSSKPTSPFAEKLQTVMAPGKNDGCEHASAQVEESKS